MIKILVTVRNRLAITKKCIESIKLNTTSSFQLFVYDNLSSYRFRQHIDYYVRMFQQGIITKFVINSKQSTFDCFSKVCSFNEFGFDHEQDPNKDDVDFLLLLDNDMILTPGWDKYALKAINHVKENMSNIHIITQFPGGVTDRNVDELELIDNMKCQIGTNGGSGFWILRPTFFRDIGFLDCSLVQGLTKKHDQNYWEKISHKVRGKKFSLTIPKIMSLHTGSITGSICNQLTKEPGNTDNIRFVDKDQEIDNMSFIDFYNQIKDRKDCQIW